MNLMIDERISPEKQVDILESLTNEDQDYHFNHYLQKSNRKNLKSDRIEIFQMNLGKMCNQACKHCHVDAGPDRKEIMTKETMLEALIAIEKSGAKIIDLTGGAPEMNPHFYWFVEELSKKKLHVMVRCNLTILMTKKHDHAFDFYKKHRVEVISSLPFYSEKLTDTQRGSGVFQKSIKALQRLNQIGYGKEDSELKLNLVYNPIGAFLPGDQKELELEYKRNLDKEFGISFNDLYTITNMPISRFLEYLIHTDNYEDYMNLLIESFNPSSIDNLMCRNTISVSWDGFLYDCDFNQMLDLKLNTKKSQHLRDWNNDELLQREIVTGNHCYGCTAGSGSSCGGSLT
jgi:radical SAM/Cys-rich protein